ncbi:glutathione-disulfide reductase [Marinimicrobium alkaliphilum]|uniref:glutathione-disulfide reductase n=1 Tax=Marinimicrobium alkaliphilum TaxID=2202654 RepID=UPI000DBA680A|nr:glutathione-disulfide reductase [Marinimicrobium alkaliphilum]
MSQYDYDLLVIGAGSGGVRASRMAAQMGQRVAVAEDRYLGGTCVNVGCVPKKLLVYGAHFSETLHMAPGYGWHPGAVRFNWRELRDNKDREIERLNGIYAKLLDNAGVTLLNGRASLVDAHTVSIAGKRYTAERILLAVGGWPWVPEFPGREHVITSNEAFYLDELPKRIVVVGGGYIALEFAGIFNGLGVETHLVYRGPMFLRGFDQDVREAVLEEMREKGIHLHFNTDIAQVIKHDKGLRASTQDGREFEVGQVMYATGRRPKLDGLGLENTRVQVNDRGAVVVDERFQTAEPSIYALGDMVGHAELTPVALAQAMSLVRNLYGEGEAPPLDYQRIPTAVFTQPPIATIGLTEAEAREQCEAVEVYKTRFRPMQYSLTDIPERTLMKLVVDKATDKVVGCHMVGPEAGEIIQGLAVAMTAGATKADFDRTLGIHPTAAEEFVTLREPVPE